MGGHRAGMQYRTNRLFTGGEMERTAHGLRDAAYRRALGLGDSEPLPRALGGVRHARPVPDTRD
jgi:hypothetical protein